MEENEDIEDKEDIEDIEDHKEIEELEDIDEHHTPKLEQRLANHKKMLQSRRDLRKKALEAIDNVKENRTKVVSVAKLEADMNAFEEDIVNSPGRGGAGHKSEAADGEIKGGRRKNGKDPSP